MAFKEAPCRKLQTTRRTNTSFNKETLGAYLVDQINSNYGDPGNEAPTRHMPIQGRISQFVMEHQG